MIETTLPLAPDRRATVLAPDPARLLEQWAALRRESAALRTQSIVLQERVLTVVASCRQRGQRLLDFLAAAGEAALQGSPPRPCYPRYTGSERLPPEISR